MSVPSAPVGRSVDQTVPEPDAVQYDSSIHCDLLEQLTFYGAMRKFNLDFCCKTFGIRSPKSGGITGMDMQSLFEEKRFLDIARYNLGDLKATAELFLRWEEYLSS